MILNQPEWPIDEDSSISEPTLYIQDGAIIALLNTALLFAAFFSICVIFSQVSESNFSKKMVSLENVVFKRTFQAWMVTVGSLASFALVIVLCVANYDRWVLRYSANSWWEGGLSTCKDCDEQIADLEWSCLAAITCYMSS